MGTFKRAWPFRLWLAGLALIIVISGCAGFGKINRAKPPPRQSDQLAEAVMRQDGASVISVADSQYGPGQATLGTSYLSAMGQPCRQLLFVSDYGQRHNLSICSESDGAWVTAPDVFADPVAPAQGKK